MGNCCRHESSMIWAGDDWASSVVSPKTRRTAIAEKQSLLLGHDSSSTATSLSLSSSSSSSSSMREVKIKITKKQLEEMLGRADVHDMPVDQVISGLIKASDHFDDVHEHHHGSWRPVLQSIPELN